MTQLDNSLDTILMQLGDFGKYQIIVFTLISIGVILDSALHVAFVFTAMDSDYRCKVVECDEPYPTYDPPWLVNAVPFTDGKPSKCTRYSNSTASGNFSTCSRADYLTITETCDSFVYKTEKRSILQEYNLHCNDNLWKLTLVGTINSVGQFFGLFISGICSDKFGRKMVFILGLVFCALFGLMQTLASSYIWFLVLGFFSELFGAGTFGCGFVIGVEFVGPSKRVFTSTLLSVCYVVGEIMTAAFAWIFDDWRSLIYSLYVSPMILIVYFWFLPESIRWNLSKGKLKAAKDTLRDCAKYNKSAITEESLVKLTASVKPETKQSIFEIFKSKRLVLRLLNCCFSWITCVFLFFSLSLNAVSLAGNPYLDFIYTALIEIPAYVVCIYGDNKLGRRTLLSGSYFLTGLSCFVYIFLPSEMYIHRLVCWLVGKFGATIAFTIIYVITSELFPTPLRHSIMGLCSTLGRIGSMVAPQVPLLATIWAPLPMLLFSVMSTAAGALTLFFPETGDTKLPDTIEEAKRLCKNPT